MVVDDGALLLVYGLPFLSSVCTFHVFVSFSSITVFVFFVKPIVSVLTSQVWQYCKGKETS